MDNRTINEHYNEVMHELIEERPELEQLKYADITIICLSSDAKKKSKGRKVLGLTEKIADKLKWSMPCDITITVFEPNVIGLNDEQIKILLFHELLHVGVDAEKPYIKPHDLEDFKLIIDEFGTDWAKPMF